MMIAGPIQGREMRVSRPLSIHNACGHKRRAAERARPDTGILLGRCSLSAWSARGCRSGRSTFDPRRAWASRPCLRQSRWTAAAMIRGRGVIHRLGLSELTGSLASPVNNSGNGIRAALSSARRAEAQHLQSYKRTADDSRRYPAPSDTG
jgi:hypothetical protein